MLPRRNNHVQRCYARNSQAKKIAGVRGDGELFVGQYEFSDDGVVESFGAGAVGADIVCGPESPEHVAAGGELAHEVLQAAVVRVAVTPAALIV